MRTTDEKCQLASVKPEVQGVKVNVLPTNSHSELSSLGRWMMRTISASRGLCRRDKVPNLWLKAVGRNLSCRLFHLSRVNPFAASACKISGLKGTHIHACKQYIWRYYNYSTFSIVRFDRNPFMRSSKVGKKALIISNLAFVLVVLRVTAWQWKG